MSLENVDVGMISFVLEKYEIMCEIPENGAKRSEIARRVSFSKTTTYRTIDRFVEFDILMAEGQKYKITRLGSNIKIAIEKLFSTIETIFYLDDIESDIQYYDEIIQSVIRGESKYIDQNELKDNFIVSELMRDNSLRWWCPRIHPGMKNKLKLRVDSELYTKLIVPPNIYEEMNDSDFGSKMSIDGCCFNNNLELLIFEGGENTTIIIHGDEHMKRAIKISDKNLISRVEEGIKNND